MKQNRFILFLCIGVFLLSLAVVQAEAKKPTVMFDQGHGQKFVIEKEGDLQLSKLSGLLDKEVYDAQAITGQMNDAEIHAQNCLSLFACSSFLKNAANSIRFILDKEKRIVLL